MSTTWFCTPNEKKPTELDNQILPVEYFTFWPAYFLTDEGYETEEYNKPCLSELNIKPSNSTINVIQVYQNSRENTQICDVTKNKYSLKNKNF